MERKLRWGILGAASIAETMAEGIGLSGNGTVAAIASRSLAKAQQWAEAHGVPQVFGSYDALLKCGEVDVIYNPLPNSLHAEWTIRALEAGLPVLCEKPFTANAAEACEVARVSAETGVLVAEAFMYRFHPMYEKVFELLREKAIGEITFVYSTFTWFLDDRSAVPASAQLAGGALLDVGCYPVNLSRMVASHACACEPQRACAFMRGTDVDDTLVGLLEFPNGVLAEIECSIESHERVHAEIVGTAGAIVLERPWNPGGASASFTLCRNGKSETIVTPGANRYQLEAEDFVRAVVNKTPPRWTVADAVANMAAIDALLASARKGSVVPVKNWGEES
jgi:predicted dehydrogenase